MLHDNHLVMDDRNKIIVDGAKITCTYAQETGGVKPAFVYLRIDCNHGFLENGHLCAHEDTCVPELNIPKFKFCTSPYYLNMLQLLNAWESEDPQLIEAARVYSNAGTWLPCIQPLLDKWMNVSEKSVIEDYFDLALEFDFAPISKEIDLFMKQTGNKADLLCMEGVQKEGYIPTEEQIERDRVNIENINKVKATKKAISKNKKIIEKNLAAGEFYVKNLELEHVKDQLKAICDQLQEIKNAVGNLYSVLPYNEKQYKKVTDMLDEAITEVEALYNNVVNFKPKERHWLTMDSYLICRGGGILSFYSSGQEYEDYCNLLLDRIRELTQLIITECEDRLSNNRREGSGSYIGTISDEEGYSYKKVIEVMETYQRMLDGENIKEEEIKTGVILELVSNSYFEEIRKKTMALVSIAVLMAGNPTVSLVYAAVGLASAVKDGNLITGYNSAISIDEVTQQTLPKAAYKYNNYFAYILAAIDFLSRSSETWIREINLTIFCENAKELSDWAPDYEVDYAFMGTLVLKSDGTRDEASPFRAKIKLRKEYTQSCEWNSTKLFGVIRKDSVGTKPEKDITKMGYHVITKLNPEDVKN